MVVLMFLLVTSSIEQRQLELPLDGGQVICVQYIQNGKMEK